MNAHRNRLLRVLLLGLMLPMTATATDLGTDAYHLPLVDAYAIHRSNIAFSDSTERGRYQLVRVMPSGSGWGSSGSILVERVESVAVQDRVIFGASTDGFFILDANHSDQQPQIVGTRDEWESALRSFGISDASVVRTPDVIAAGMSEQVLRPWNYRVMRGLLGFSDDNWSLIVQLIGFALAFAVGIVWKRNKPPIGIAVVLGLIVNVVAQIVIAGGGPGAFVGFLALPLWCTLAAVLGKGLRTITSVGRPTRA